MDLLLNFPLPPSSPPSCHCQGKITICNVELMNVLLFPYGIVLAWVGTNNTSKFNVTIETCMVDG